MKRARLQTGIGFLILAVAVLLISGSAWAVVLAPDSSVTTSGTTLADRPELAGTVIKDESFSFTGADVFGNVYFTGTLQAQIVRETTAGTLDFYYQVTNDPDSKSYIKRLSATDFTGWLTDVDFRTDMGGTVGSSTAESGLFGSTISFNLQIYPDEDSMFMFIKTNATAYTEGSVVLLDGGQAAVRAFAPAVPEPGTLLLLGSGLVGLALYARRRILNN